MHAKFVTNTSNVKRFLGGIAHVDKRGASEASWLAVIGEPGHGKTRTLQWWAVQNKGIYLRAKANWRPHWMLSELAGELLGSEISGSYRTLYLAVLRELGLRGCPIVIDEAWNMLHDMRLFETIRDFSDNVENVIVIGGEDRVTQRLAARAPQIVSRMTDIVAFKPATLDDVRACCDTLAEVKIDDSLVAEILRQSRGYLREVKNAIAKAETHGKRNAGKPVTAKDMEGVELCRDRKGGLPSPRP